MKQGNTIIVLKDYIRIKIFIFILKPENFNDIYVTEIFIITFCILIYEGNIIRHLANR